MHVDSARWREHLDGFLADAAKAGGRTVSRDVATPDPTVAPPDPAVGGAVEIVPVTKGNGYGFGNAVLAGEASLLGASTLAVGTYAEVNDVSTEFGGDITVLTPWRPWCRAAFDDPRIIHTASRIEDLRRLAEVNPPPRVVVEVLTSMRRHGIKARRLSELTPLIERVRFEGFAVHLPLDGSHAAEARDIADQAFAVLPGGDRPPLWVSHLPVSQAGTLATHLSADVRLRVATALWLGNRGALTAQATVLDTQPVRRGETYGYRQRRARRNGTILIVAGGTAHGIGMEAPKAVSTLRQRAAALAKGGLESAGHALSPFQVGGKQRWFTEPPHMQCSMIWLPDGVEAPAVGAKVGVDVRFTTTMFDQIIWA